MNEQALALRLKDIEVVPYVRMTQKGKYVDKRAQRYMHSQALIRQSIDQQIKDLFNNCQLTLYTHERKIKMGNATANIELKLPLPPRTPFQVSIFFDYPENKNIHYCDIDNLAKAIMDAGNKLVYWDDMWCDEMKIVRTNDGERDNPVAEVSVGILYQWLS